VETLVPSGIFSRFNPYMVQSTIFYHKCLQGECIEIFTYYILVGNPTAVHFLISYITVSFVLGLAWEKFIALVLFSYFSRKRINYYCLDVECFTKIFLIWQTDIHTTLFEKKININFVLTLILFCTWFINF